MKLFVKISRWIKDKTHPLRITKREFRLRAKQNIAIIQAVTLIGNTLDMMGYPLTDMEPGTNIFTNHSGNTTIVHGITKHQPPMIYLVVVTARSPKEIAHILERLGNLSVFER